jgi:hypothetical protein
LHKEQAIVKAGAVQAMAANPGRNRKIDRSPKPLLREGEAQPFTFWMAAIAR